MDTLPSVLSYLTSGETAVAKFVKPTLGIEINEVIIESPKPTIMAIRLLTLSTNMVIPMHVHRSKEKVYICKSPATFKVVLIINGKDYVYSVASGQVFVVPPNTPHFVHLLTDRFSVCNVVVVSSSQDGADIVWEDRADMLVRETIHR